MVSEDSTCTAARKVSCAAAARAAVCGVRHNSQKFMQWSGNIGWLSEPLHRVDADCSGCTNLKMQTHGKNTGKKIRSNQNTPRKPQQPGDRDHLNTACDETRSLRSPTFARFHKSRVCGNRPRAALAISKNDECYTHTDRHTD